MSLNSLFAQDDFVAVYTKIEKARAYQKVLGDAIRKEKDPTLMKAASDRYNRYLNDTVLPIVNGVMNQTFPDITFLGLDSKDYSVSDFSKNDLIIYMTDPNCLSCIEKMYSEMMTLNDPGLKTLVFFADSYYNHPISIKDFGDKLVYGFINDENKNLITFRLGDIKYYLDENRKVLFLDKTHREDYELAWTNFLISLNK